MKKHEIKRRLSEEPYGTLLSEIYPDRREAAKERIFSLIDLFEEKYGEGRDIVVCSAPGRSEICGNHTDHNGGVVIGASIDRDIIAVAARRNDDKINIKSTGRREDSITLDMAMTPKSFPDGRSASLIGGVVRGFVDKGYKVGGFDCYTTSEVLAGSGLSSSAAFEGVIAAVVNHLYAGGEVSPIDIAKIGQFAENVYYHKPSGLLDQMASAIGGYVYMDFSGEEPKLSPIDFRPDRYGYRLCIVATGGSHADLGDDYAAVPSEMKAVAKMLGGATLSEVDPAELYTRLPEVRLSLGDRAVMRAIHYYRECERVGEMRSALERGDLPLIIDVMKRSGDSSFKYLQNVYTNKAVDEQGLSLALMLTDDFLRGREGGARVHGGGFAGTIQALIRKEDVDSYREVMEKVFGEGSVMVLNVRPHGNLKIIG